MSKQRASVDQELVRKLADKVDTVRVSLRKAQQTSKALDCAAIHYISDLVQKTEADLLRKKHFGRWIIRELKEHLDAIGLSLGMELDQATVAAINAEIARRRTS